MAGASYVRIPLNLLNVLRILARSRQRNGGLKEPGQFCHVLLELHGSVVSILVLPLGRYFPEEIPLAIG